MLNALMHWRDPAVAPAGGAAAFRLDRGRILVCQNEAGRQRFEALWQGGGEAAGGQLVELNRPFEPLPKRALFVRASADPEAGAQLDALEPQLELLARDGGSVLIALADELAPPSFTQGLIPGPAGKTDAPRMQDDQGLTLRYARQGDWVQLHWPVAHDTLAGAETLILRCQRGPDEWLSAPQPLAAWHPFTAGAQGLVTELAIPWPPGSYRLRLEIQGGNRKPKAWLPPFTLAVKASTVNPLPHEFSPHWRLPGLRPVAANLAGLTLLNAAGSRVELSPEATAGLKGGWHDAESRADGGWRRWIGEFAQWSLAGTGELLLDIEDHRARGADDAPTGLTLFLDGRRHAHWEIARTGGSRLHAAWPDDGLAHLATVSVHPTWSPADHGHPDDRRRLGLLINRIELQGG